MPKAPDVDIKELREALGDRLEPTKVKVCLVQQPQGSTTDGRPLEVKFQLAVDLQAIEVDSCKFESAVGGHGVLYEVTPVESSGIPPVYLLARPFILSDDTLQTITTISDRCLLTRELIPPSPEDSNGEGDAGDKREGEDVVDGEADRSDGESEGASGISISKSSLTRLSDPTELELTFALLGCYTSTLKSPIYIVLTVLESTDKKAGKGAVCKPVSVYERYEEQADNPILSAAFNDQLKRLKELLAAGDAVDVTDAAGATALQVACLYGNEACVKELLKSKARLNKADRDGRTALHKAAYSGEAGCMRLLLKKKKIKVAPTDRGGATPMHIAAYKNQVECGTLLLDAESDIDVIDDAGATPLHQACYQGHPEFVTMLLQRGARTDIRDRSGSSALEISCYNGRTECAELLFNAGASTTEDNLLYHTCFFGHAACLKLLLDYTALNAATADNELATPLHKAAFSGHKECVAILLANGVDVDCRDEEGATPLHQACYKGFTSCIQALIEAGANVEAQDGEGGTPLHNACFNGHQDAVSLLLANGAKPVSLDVSQSTPLHFAAENGHTDCMRILLEYKVPIDARDEDGITPLHQGVNFAETVQLLLSHDADINAVDRYGTTALMLAVENSQEIVLRLLMSNGADATLRNNDGLTVMEITDDPYLKKVLEEEGAGTDAEKAVRKKLYDEAGVLFNQKPKNGVNFLMDEVMKRQRESDAQREANGDAADETEERIDPIDEVVHFLHRHNVQLNKVELGNMLGEHDEQSTLILDRFIRYMDFENMEFDQALRMFLSKFRLPGEAQKIDRIMETFAARYHENNPGTFQNADMAYMLAFSLIMLNTDLHNPSIKHKMTPEQFIKNNSSTGLGDDLPVEFLRSMYDNILENEIKMDASDMSASFGNSVAIKNGWLTKQGGRIKTWKKRWFILSDGVLYYFKEKQEETSAAIGIVPLEDVVVRNAESKRKYCFELVHSNESKGESMKALKRAEGRGLQKGHHDSYFLCATSTQEMEEWMNAISSSVFSNPLEALILKKRAMRESEGTAPNAPSGSSFTSGVKLDFTELLETLTMCQVCSAAPADVTKAFPDALVDTSHKSARLVLVTSSVARTHTLVLGWPQWASVEELRADLEKKTYLPDHYGFFQVAKQLRKSIQKHLKKEYSIAVAGHGRGGSLGVALAMLLQQKSYHVGRVTTFGQPKALSEKLVAQAEENNLPLTCVAHHKDPIPTLFPTCPPYGSKVTLLKSVHYCHQTTIDHEAAFTLDDITSEALEAHSIESYLRNFKAKVDMTVKVPYHLRQHYQ